MKKSLLWLGLMLFVSQVMGQKSLPQVGIKSIDGKNTTTAAWDNQGNPIVVSFWATWCKPCIQELNTIAEVYEEWQKETGMKLIAVSIDDARNTAKVPGFIKGKDWKYEVYLDPNGDLKRALGVNNVPHTFLLDGKKQIVWDHNSYTPGDEQTLLQHIKDLKEGKEIKH